MAEVIQNLVARICPLQSEWTWEAIPKGENSFLVSIPTREELERVDGMDMGVP
jgi:hypothetical protein